MWANRRGVKTPEWSQDDIPHIIKRQARRIPLQDVLRLLDALPERYRTFGRFLLLTGLRLSEGLAVQRTDLDGSRLHVWCQRPSNGVIRRPKTEKGDRVVVLFTYYARET